MIFLSNIPMITPSKEKILPVIIQLAANKTPKNKQIWNLKTLFKIPTKSETTDSYSCLLFVLDASERETVLTLQKLQSIIGK